VLAVGAIAAGVKLMEYAGELLAHSSWEKRLWEYRDNRHKYVFEIPAPDGEPAPAGSDGRTAADVVAAVDATRKGNVARFVNHSCEPNLDTVRSSARSLCPPRLYMWTAREIKPGEWLTIECVPRIAKLHVRATLTLGIAMQLLPRCGGEARRCKGLPVRINRVPWLGVFIGYIGRNTIETS
jgi:hypothetical protein